MKPIPTHKMAAIVFFMICLFTRSFSQNQDSGSKALQEQWITLSKTGEPHQLLSGLTGDWTFTGRHIPPEPGKRSFSFHGFFKQKNLWGGRYFIWETMSGSKMKMPWSGDSLVAYQDMSIVGYDNVQKKFFLSTLQNEAATGLVNMEGNYDPVTKTFTYQTETSAHMHGNIPAGTPFHIVWTIQLIDHDHFNLTAKESVDGKPVVTTEIKYNRAQK